LDSSGNFQKPAGWTGRRASPGKIQEAISRIQLARNAALGSLSADEVLKRKLDRSLEYFQPRQDVDDSMHKWDVEKASIQTSIESVIFALKMFTLGKETFGYALEDAARTAKEAIPTTTIAGLAFGGDMFSAARGAILANYGLAKAANTSLKFAKEFAVGAFTTAKNGYTRIREAEFVGPLMRSLGHREAVLELDATLG